MKKTKFKAPEIDDEYNLVIQKIGDKGDGIGFIGKFVIIVKGKTILGETYLIIITKVLEKYAFAEIVKE